MRVEVNRNRLLGRACRRYSERIERHHRTGAGAQLDKISASNPVFSRLKLEILHGAPSSGEPFRT
jgi:hypothetical protein